MKALLATVWARRTSALFRYSLPFVVILMAILLQLAVSQVVPKQRDFPYVLFFLVAIFAAAWIGGYAAGVIAIFVTMVGIPLAVSRDFHLADLDLMRLTLLSGLSLLFSRVAQVQSRKQSILRDANAELDKRVQAKTKDLAETIARLESEAVQREKVERALRESEVRVDYALDAAGIGRWDLDLATLRVERSLRHDQLFGYQELLPEWTHETFLNHVHPDDRDSVNQAFQATLAHGELFEFECRIRRADGEIRWIWGRGKLLRDSTGKPLSILGSTRDITKRKTAEELLRENEARTRAIIDAALDGVIVMDAGGRVLEFNPAAERIFGRPGSQTAGHRVADVIIPPRFRAQHTNGLARYLATGESAVLNRRLELSALHANGKEFPLELSIAPMPGSGPPRFTGFLRDISERKAAENALRESEERFRIMADTAPVLIWVSGTDKGLTWFNQRWVDFVGRPMERDLGNGWAEIVHPDDLKACKATYFSAFDSRQPFTVEFRLRRHDGQWRWILGSGVPRYAGNQEFAGYVGSSLDITEERAAREALLESQARYQALADSIPLLVWTCSTDGRYDYVNRQWVDYTGRQSEELLGYGWAQLLHPQDRDRVLSVWAKATVRGDKFDTECRIRRADGAYRWFKTGALPLRDPGGRVVKWFGSHTDFEDHKQAAQKSQEQLARMSLLDQITRGIAERLDVHSVFQVVVRSVEEKMPVDFSCICLYDPAASSLAVACVGVRNEAVVADLAMAADVRVPIDRNGLSRCVQGQLIYEPDVTKVPFPFPQRIAGAGLRSLVAAPLAFESQVFGVLIAARREAEAFSSGDCEFLRQLSEHVALAAHQSQMYDALQRAYDDLRQSQQSAMEQERLRVLGQMSSGIAHDINNALSPVALYTESLLESEPGLSPRTRAYLETTQRAIEDVAHTVARMREFYRKHEEQLVLKPVQLNELIQQVLDLTHALWADMPQQRGIVIQLDARLDPGIPPVPGIDSEIREALTNLILNAVDAMPEGGTLTVRTAVESNAKGTEPSHVRVEVADTGIGMDEETRRRCLEPFFTTKGERGTGLGLAMVYGVTQRHGAEIELKSAPGAGTTAIIRFAAMADSPQAGSTAEAIPRPARLRLLIVDDDPLLIRSLRETLEGDGHTVLPASGGQAGIDLFRASVGSRESFDAVITDLGMPYVDGRKVAHNVKAASPGTPVILLTGWGQRLVADGDVPPDVDRVLNKPPKLRDLRKALTDLLTGRKDDKKPVAVG
jgi:PAS domain S-box-containing protein